MEIDGTLAKWNKNRGFGFITPRRGGQDVFVHITAFPKDGQQPRPGELLSFEVITDQKGRNQAVKVSRPGRTKASRTPESDSTQQAGRKSGLFVLLFVLAMLAAAGVYYLSQ